MKKIALSFLILLILITLFACDNNGNGNNNTPTEDPFYTKGFTKDETDGAKMIDDLFGCLMNSVRPLSVPDASKSDASLLAEIGVNLNGFVFDLEVKLNYSHNKKQENKMSLVMRQEGGDTEMYYYGGSEYYNFYLNANDTKLKIPISEEYAISVFPMDTGYIGTLGAGLQYILKTKDSIKYEYKLSSGGMQRHYYCKIDLGETLTALLTLSNLFDIDVREMEALIQNILGVSANDIKSGRMPDTTVEIEFMTAGGKQTQTGFGLLSNIKFGVDAKASSNKNTIFMGEAYKAVIDVKVLDIKKPLLNTIPDESSLSDYIAYNDRNLKVALDFNYQGDSTDYDFLLDLFYNTVKPDESRITAEVKGEDGESVFKANFSDGVFKISVPKGEAECQMDLQIFLNEFNIYWLKAPKPDLIDLLVYAVGALRLQGNHEVVYKYEYDKFFTLIYLAPDILIDMLDTASGGVLSEMLEENGIDFISYFQKQFSVGLKLDDLFYFLE